MGSSLHSFQVYEVCHEKQAIKVQSHKKGHTPETMKTFTNGRQFLLNEHNKNYKTHICLSHDPTFKMHHNITVSRNFSEIHNIKNTDL
jgi:hypothetical protein